MLRAVCVRRRRSVAALVAVSFAAGLLLSGCGDDGDGGASSTSTSSSTTAASVSTTSNSSGSTSTSAVTSTTTPRDRWVGVTWTPDAGNPQQPTVDGKTVGLTSVFASCVGTGTDCGRALDLLTAAEVTGAPPSGPHLLWSSR